MHNATTKQRRAALRRHLGIFLGSLPSWFRRRRAREPAPPAGAERLEDLGAADTAATAPAMTPAPSPGASGQVGQTLVAPPGAASATMAATTAPVVQPSFRAASWAASGPMARSPAPAPTRASAPDREGGPRPRRRAAVAVAVVALAAALAALALARRGPASPSASVAAGREGGEPLAAWALPAAAAPSPAAPSPAAARSAGPPPGEHPPAVSAGHPASPATTARTVVVRRGDTLWDLCARHLGDPYAWPRIHALNRDRVANPDLIFPGQEIRIPGT
jgi:hypothetical protein